MIPKVGTTTIISFVQIELIESAVLKCDELELHQIASLSLQMCAQNFLKTGQDGSVIFNVGIYGSFSVSEHILIFFFRFSY